MFVPTVESHVHVYPPIVEQYNCGQYIANQNSTNHSSLKPQTGKYGNVNDISQRKSRSYIRTCAQMWRCLTI